MNACNHSLLHSFLLLLITLSNIEGSFDKVRFPGNYCLTRRPEQCCNDRNDDCSVPIGDRIHSSLCYCDQFCYQHSVEDCCPDFIDVCLDTERPTDSPPEECVLGETCMQQCNECECIRKSKGVWPSLKSVNGWNCTEHACINDDSIIKRINTNRYGWTATSHPMFAGIKLKDGMQDFLGTILPKLKVFEQKPLSAYLNQQAAYSFDARSRWRGLIQPAMNQGKCGASWAFSAAGVAADRWSIQSQGLFSESLSVQQMISCSQFITSRQACTGGRVEDAWWWLNQRGVVKESCYPYTSGDTREKGTCYTNNELVCQKRQLLYPQKTTPAYRLPNNEQDIMLEIQRNGPVQAILKVRADFFLYNQGVYHYTSIPDSMNKEQREALGYHSVKLIGWGVENGMKYWLAVNSWGTTWGENGMFKIKRGENESDIERFVVAAWARINLDQVQPVVRRRHFG